MRTVAVLFADPHGVYSRRDGVEIWDAARDARRYAGPYPVIAHPPCARWSVLAGLVEARHGIPRHDDGGLFAFALAAVRRYGGVLEHPAGSAAFVKHGLTPPQRAGWKPARIDASNEWVREVDQSHYGHAAQKPTWIFACGCDLPVLPVMPGPQINDRPRGGGLVQNRLSKRQRAATPPAFADVLLAMARSVSR